MAVDSTSKSFSNVQVKIIIVGAGISGLTAAVQSAISGHSVLVLESAKELGEVSHPIHFISCHIKNLINAVAK